MVIGLIVFCSNVFASDWKNTLSEYKCLEVEKFTVDRENFANKALERAALIPDERLISLQHRIVGEVTRGKVFSKVVKAGSECLGKTMVFGGQVTDYKEGSRTARMFVGLAAGQQKFEVESYLKDKETGGQIASKRIVDRKMGGWSGGDEAKGESDFAEKVRAFIKRGS